jgi:hypothetical protein
MVCIIGSLGKYEKAQFLYGGVIVKHVYFNRSTNGFQLNMFNKYFYTYFRMQQFMLT